VDTGGDHSDARFKAVIEVIGSGLDVKVAQH
jgi:hypothetical protein